MAPGHHHHYADNDADCSDVDGTVDYDDALHPVDYDDALHPVDDDIEPHLDQPLRGQLIPGQLRRSAVKLVRRLRLRLVRLVRAPPLAARFSPAASV
jgi:hypothetical protein